MDYDSLLIAAREGRVRFLRPDDPRPVSQDALRQLHVDIAAGRVIAVARDEWPAFDAGMQAAHDRLMAKSAAEVAARTAAETAPPAAPAAPVAAVVEPAAPVEPVAKGALDDLLG